MHSETSFKDKDVILLPNDEQDTSDVISEQNVYDVTTEEDTCNVISEQNVNDVTTDKDISDVTNDKDANDVTSEDDDNDVTNANVIQIQVNVDPNKFNLDDVTGVSKSKEKTRKRDRIGSEIKESQKEVVRKRRKNKSETKSSNFALLDRSDDGKGWKCQKCNDQFYKCR